MAQKMNALKSHIKLNPYAFANALGLIGIITTVVYAALVWFGGYDASVIIAQYPVSFAFDDWTFLFGIVQTYVISYVFGWIFARIYNRFS